MPTLDDVRQLTARSRLLVQRNRAYLRRLEDELAQTRCVIERATAAYTVSDRLLRKIDGFALEAPDHKTMPVNEPPPCSIPCPRCQSSMVWYHAVLADTGAFCRTAISAKSAPLSKSYDGPRACWSRLARHNLNWCRCTPLWRGSQRTQRFTALLWMRRRPRRCQLLPYLGGR